jgi:hypothetical protein
MSLDDFLTINRKVHEVLEEIPAFHLLQPESITPEKIHSLANHPLGATPVQILELLGGREAYLEKQYTAAGVPFILPYLKENSDLAHFNFVHIHPFLIDDKELFRAVLYDLPRGYGTIYQFLARGLHSPTTIFEEDDFRIDIPKDLSESSDSAGHNRTLYTSLHKTIGGSPKKYRLTIRITQGFHAVAQRVNVFELNYWIHRSEKLDPRIDPTGKFEIKWKNGAVSTYGLAAKVNLDDFTFHSGAKVSDGTVYLGEKKGTVYQKEVSAVLQTLLDCFRFSNEETVSGVAGLQYIR